MKCKYHRNEISEVLKLVNYLYEDLEECCGGLLHIVLDDGNLDDEDIQWCLNYCNEKENEDRKDKAVCIEIAQRMLNMTEFERRLIYYGDMNFQCDKNCENCVIEKDEDYYY